MSSIRSVWSKNVDDEFKLIGSLIDQYSYVSMDTEFPGFLVAPPSQFFDGGAELYCTVKANVDRLKLIQVGLTCSDADGNLPVDGKSQNEYIWEFNLKDFDENVDEHSKKSIYLLKKHGMDFDKNHKDGIDTNKFAALMMSSGLVCNDEVTWVTFHGLYDFAYLIKILTGQPLPDEYNQFKKLMKVFFGNEIYDVKHMMKDDDILHGGLSNVARILEVKREAGESHQAGSDSLLTCRVFQKMKNRCKGGLEKYVGIVHGL